MKNILASIPNRLKAIYLIWFTLHFVLIILSEESLRYKNEFFPFFLTHKSFSDATTIDGLRLFGHHHYIISYDYSEFLIYIVTPILLYFIFKLWTKKDVKE